jgi:hypothetical protein
LFALFALTHPHPQIMVPLLPAEAAAAEVEKIEREAAQHNISELDLEAAAAELVAPAQPAAATELQRKEEQLVRILAVLGQLVVLGFGLGAPRT